MMMHNPSAEPHPDTSSKARLVAGSGCPELARSVAARLGDGLVECELVRFPDGEHRPRVGSVRDMDVYVLSSTGPPVDEHLVGLTLLLDACRRGGAARLTAVVPYFGYARQDRRSRPGEPVGARLVAELLKTAGAQRLVVVDPHSSGFEAACPVPAEALSALPPLLERLRSGRWGVEVVVAPDLGAVKLAEAAGTALGLPVAFVRKRRITETQVEASELVGEVDGRRALVIDDMIATGGTIEAAVRLLAAHGAAPGVSVLATHGLFVDDAPARLQALGLTRLLVSDSATLPREVPGGLEVCSLAPLLAAAISRLTRGERLDDLERFA